eukprot:CAMPEP_0204859306 /NCGR_PEP_ID=MMETSP1347-20130617/23617_1 /ASSEMBLY_ACC=CAM_ASM_000690 /TAXON_ID=215587 /ORGANISM="Aplanochytrium stocchinoi, Strain GSBS06" /LENGTH=41 /DNA_ID= /DNA_START= /DNA_END= /DNA_ORIENTATION=
MYVPADIGVAWFATPSTEYSAFTLQKFAVLNMTVRQAKARV